jgi:hypothetical protein
MGEGLPVEQYQDRSATDEALRVSLSTAIIEQGVPRWHALWNIQINVTGY